ncbi:alpha-glucan family phosphorylase [Natronospora cellulosivora (SeqCode)]
MTVKEKSNVAYFCMEYGLHSDFKIYAGGLGILAGDYLKAAKDMELPVLGVGILWKQGYTQQLIDSNGKVYDSYPNYKYDFLEDTKVKVKVKIRGRDVYCKVWQVNNFDNNPLILLDTDLPENNDQWISGQLYGWFGEERIAQEMVLGIAGVRALRELDFEPDVYHFNEGHAVFAGIELIREKMEEEGMDFEEAWEETREEIVFTTHTPIIQGNEEHPHKLLEYMGAYQNLSLEQMAAIGGVPFNMTVAGLRLSYISNGVSELHSKTANKMWEDVDNSSEIIPITNGVHRPSWVSSKIIDCYQDKDKLWTVHMENKEELINYVKEKTGQQLKKDLLLIGFSRRAAPYKRGTFIFSELEKIEAYLKDSRIQIIFSGKAHPLDDVGKKIVAKQYAMAKKYPKSVVFLEDYSMEIGSYLVKGCDLWLNNPRRPKEACGTSGIKAAMNGVLNFSTLDGWWPEAYQEGKNGWQLGNGKEAADFEGKEKEKVKKQDLNDLKSLYNILLEEIVPSYYQSREKWLEMMQNSIESTYDKFSAQRMLKDYYKKMYDIDEYNIYKY